MNGKAKAARRQGRREQRGASALEFALVLPALLFVVYAAFVYGYLFVVRESIEFAAHKGIEAAVAVDPSASNVESERQAQAYQAVNCALRWLTGVCSSAVVTSSRVEPLYTLCTGSGTTACPAGYGSVQVTYRVFKGSWLFPRLVNLPGLGTIPPMPQTMVATAIAELE